MTVSDVISTLKKIKEMSHVSTTLLKKKNQAYKKQRENTELVKMSENSAWPKWRNPLPSASHVSWTQKRQNNL